MMKDNYNSVYLIVSRFVNLFGSGIYNICIPLYLLSNTNSIVETSIFFSIIQVPAIVLLPILGVWIEKRNLKYCLIVSNVFSFILFICLGLFLSECGFHYYILLFLSILEKLCTSFYDLASQSIFPRLVSQNKIERVNGIKSVFDNLAYLISPALGAIIYGIWGIYAAIFINLLSYLFSTLLTVFLAYQYFDEDLIKESFKERFMGGIHVISVNKDVRLLFVLIMILNFLVSPTEEVFSPGIIKTVYHFSDELYGWIGSAVSAGIVVASIMIGLLRKRKSTMKTHFYMQSIIMVSAGCLSALLLDRNAMLFYLIYILLSFLSGFYSTFVNVPLISQFQILVESNYQARFFSLMKFSSYLMIPLGTVFAGQMSAYFRSDIAYMINGLIMMVFVFLIFRKME